jgi:protein-tyrosine kinase
MTRNTAVRTALEEAPLELDLDLAPVVPFRPSSDSILLGQTAASAEEFRTLRTRLEQIPSTQALQTLLIASASRADGKSFTAANLALAEAQIAGNPTLLCDFDLRNPAVHTLFGIERGPGVSDCLIGKAELPQAIRRIENSNLFVMPAGQAVVNPLELLHLSSVRRMMDRLRCAFRCIILDSPALLLASDANLLADLADGTLLVARIGATLEDSLTRAIELLGPSRILGVVANAVSLCAGRPL